MEERDFLHEICLTALSVSKAVKFAAVLDKAARLIVGESRRSTQMLSRPGRRIVEDCCLISYAFYLNYLIPITTNERRKRKFGLGHHHHHDHKHTAAIDEGIHFNLLEISNNVKIATTPLTANKDKYLFVYLDSSEPHQEILLNLINTI